MGRIRWASAFLILILLFHVPVQAVTPSQSDEVMTNQTVIELVKAKMGDGLIISMIKQSKAKFDTSAKAILQLKRAGVSDAVIQAMMAKEATPPPSSPNSKDSTPLEQSDGLVTTPTSFGIYLKQESALKQLTEHQADIKAKIGVSIIVPFASKRPYECSIPGERAQQRTTHRTPTFTVYLPGDQAATVELLSVKAEENKRMIVTFKRPYLQAGVVQAVKKKTIPVTLKPVSDKLIELIPKKPLDPGEYVLAILDLQGNNVKAWDFGVDAQR
jgi:hypothetical protein